jgi:NifU-like protein involved in Fe-S cluster formation
MSRSRQAPQDPLGPRVRALFVDLAHAGDLPPPAPEVADTICTGEAGRIAEGTLVRFSLRLSGTRVEQVRYRAYGCPYTLATCEWLARELCGRQLDAASTTALETAVGAPTAWAARLGIPAPRLGRLLVVEDALRQALGCASRP